MKLGTYVCVAMDELSKRGIFNGKTNIQKVIYFAMPEKQRSRYYHPYYYGPYSEDVQQTVTSLLKRRNVDETDPEREYVRSGRSHLDEDPIVRRLNTAATFFEKRGITQTGSISFLAKVHLLSRTKRKEARENLAEYIKKQAKFLGWKELANASLENIQQHIMLANSLEEALAG